MTCLRLVLIAVRCLIKGCEVINFVHFFKELTEPTNRLILKPSDLSIGVVYQLVDIYCMVVDNRVAIVGGFSDNVRNDIQHVWMPTSLVRNYDEKKVRELKEKIDSGKKGYAMYRGEKSTKYGTMSYDFVWVKKQ